MSITTATNLSVSNSLTVSKNSILGTDETSTLIVNSTPIFNNGITIIDDIVHESGNFYGTSGTTYFNGDIIINTGTFTTCLERCTFNSVASDFYGTVSIIDNHRLYLTNVNFEYFMTLYHDGSDAYLDFTGNLYIRNNGGVNEIIKIGSDDKTTFNKSVDISGDITHQTGNFYGTSGTTYFNGNILINSGTFTTSTSKTTINSEQTDINGIVSLIDNKKLYLTNVDYTNFLSLNHNGSNAFLDFTDNLYIRNNGGTEEIINISSDNTTTFNYGVNIIGELILSNSFNKFNSNIIMTDEHYILFTNEAANNYLQIYNNITNSYAKYYHTYAHFFSVTTNVQVLKLTESLIYLYRNSIFHKDVTISGNLSISGNIDISGNTTISGTIKIYDSSTFENNILIKNDKKLIFGGSFNDEQFSINMDSINSIIEINNNLKSYNYNKYDYHIYSKGNYYFYKYSSFLSDYLEVYNISIIYDTLPKIEFHISTKVSISGTTVVTPILFNGGVHIKRNLWIDHSDNSTSKTTGALVLRYGGLGVAGNIYCSGINASSDITTTSNVSSNVLNSTDIFASNYINETMYKKFRGYSQYINTNPSFTYSYVNYNGTIGTSSSESLTIPDSCRCVKLFYEIDINEAISTQSMTAAQYIYKRRMYSDATIWTQYLAYSVIDQSGFPLQCVITSNNILTIQFPNTTNLNDDQLFYWSYTIEIL